MKRADYPLTSIIGRKEYDGIRYNAYATEDLSQEPLAVYQSGVKKKNAPGHLSGPSMYDHYIIHYVTGGSGVYTCGNQAHPVKKGDAFLIRPYNLVKYQASAEDPYRYLWVGFNGTEARGLLSLSGFCEGIYALHYENDEQIQAIMGRIADISTISLSQRYLLTGLLYQLFSVFIEENPSPKTTSLDRNLSLAVRYIQNHLGSPNLTVQRVAAYVGLNRSHLFRLFSQAYHLSIQDFIIALRLDRAKELLAQTSYTVNEIAIGCGYSNPAHFSNLFKQRIGCSPKEYRASCAGTFLPIPPKPANSD